MRHSPVNLVNFLLIGRSKSEVSHATLDPGYKMVGNCNFERLDTMVFEVESWSPILESEVIFSNSMEDEANVGVDEGQLRMVLLGDHEGQLSGSEEKLQSCGYLNEDWMTTF